MEREEDKKEMNKKKRRETNFEEKKVVMRVGQRRERGKGSEILDQLSVGGAGSVLKVNLDLPIQSQFYGKCTISFNFRKKMSPVAHFYECDHL